jgi:hypothetical protein
MISIGEAVQETLYLEALKAKNKKRTEVQAALSQLEAVRERREKNEFLQMLCARVKAERPAFAEDAERMASFVHSAAFTYSVARRTAFEARLGAFDESDHPAAYEKYARPLDKGCVLSECPLDSAELAAWEAEYAAEAAYSTWSATFIRISEKLIQILESSKETK